MSSTDLTITSASLPERMDYARAMAASNLLPTAFRGNPANALVAIEYGNALGVAPIVALSEINVISGTPSLSASLMAALARQAGHKVRVTGDAESATCVIVRGDDPDHEHTATWTKKKAQDAGLWGRGHWAKDPGTMLRWRAISECVRFACSEVLGGLRYTPEEVREFTGTAEPVESTVTVEQAPQRSGSARLSEAVQTRTAQAGPVDVTHLPEADTEVEVEAESADTTPEAEEAAEVVPEVAMITTAQTRKMGAQMREAGLSDKADALAYVGGQIGREIASRNELTKAEASTVIDALEALLNPKPTEDTEVVEAELDPWAGESA